ncbi:MAG TPA: ABC transporter permease [Actinobacteria bacterium]|nr:ABC transporter permease [Actinomycetota bacterium]
MNARVSHASIIWSIFKKDLKEFSRDKFFMIVTAIGLVFYVAIYWLLPTTVNETITVGVHQTGMEKIFKEFDQEEDESINFKLFDTPRELNRALGLTKKKPKEQLQIGLDFPKNFLARVTTGKKTTVNVFVDSSVPKEIRRAMSGLVKEMSYSLAGQKLPVTEPDEKTIILGNDRAGNQVSLRDKTKPLYAFFILIMETFALATLIAGEIQSKTVTAVLVTPARIIDFLAAKGIVGTTVAFSEAALLMLLIRSFNNNPLILATTLLLGAILVTSLGFIAGASGKDFLGILFYSMLFMIPLMIPPIAIFFPGTASFWVKLIPSYGLVQSIVGVATYGEGWSDVWPDLVALVGWCVALFTIGAFILKRKVESL